MRTKLAGVVVVVMAGVLVVGVTGAFAQTQAPAPAAPAQTAPGAEKSLEGKVKMLDAAKKRLTLEDGTTLMIPSGVQVAELKPGATVKVSYQEQGSQKILTHIEVQK